MHPWHFKRWQILCSGTILCALGIGLGWNKAVIANPNDVQLESDIPLSIFIIGNWRGEFDIDAQGLGGLASLHTLVENKRQLQKAQKGGVLLLQNGDFTGSVAGPDFVSSLIYPDLNLVRYMKFDALGMNAREVDLWQKSIAKKPASELLQIPLVSWNHRQLNRQLAQPLAFRIMERRQASILVSSITSGKQPRYATRPLVRLMQEIHRQTGLDLSILMLNHDPTFNPALTANDIDHKKPTGMDTHDPHDDDPHDISIKKKNLSESTMDSELPDVLHGPALINRFWPSHFFHTNSVRQNPVSLPYKENLQSMRWLLAETGAPANRFERLTSGPYICRIKAKSVCQIDLRFRNGRIIEIEQRFIDLNEPVRNRSWIVPDRLLLRALKNHPRKLERHTASQS